MKEKNNLGPHIIVLLSVVIWGISQVVLEDLYQAHSATSIVFYKLFLTGLLIVVVKPKACIKAFRPLHLITGLLGHSIYYLFTAYAVILSSVNFLAIVLGTLPLMALLFERIVYKEKIHTIKVMASIISVVGMVLLSGQLQLKGNLLIALILALLANLSWLLYLKVKKDKEMTDSIEGLGVECLSSSVIMLPFAFLEGGFAPILGMEWIQLIYVSLISTGLAYYLYLRGSQFIDLVMASIYINLMPVITLLVYLVLAGQLINIKTLVGMVLIVMAITMSYKSITSRVTNDTTVYETHPHS